MHMSQSSPGDREGKILFSVPGNVVLLIDLKGSVSLCYEIVTDRVGRDTTRALTRLVPIADPVDLKDLTADFDQHLRVHVVLEIAELVMLTLVGKTRGISTVIEEVYAVCRED